MASAGKRLIDAVPAVPKRPKEMQVLCLGISRTGTYSMYTALGMLGYKSYHCAQIRFDPAGTYALWNEGLRAKYRGQGKRYEKAEFDKLLGQYDAVTDIPCIMFTEELLEAYPDAKVLITVRDEDSWLRSVMGLFNTLLGWNWGFIAQYNKPFIQDYVEMIGFVWDIWTGGDNSDEAKLRQTFRDHYALVRSKVPKDKLLVFNPKQGWEPLCKHLGITKVPTEPYPHINELPFTIKIFKIIWWTTALKAAQMIALKTLVPGAMVGAGLWYWMFM